jgi:hypothetical protein
VAPAGTAKTAHLVNPDLAFALAAVATTYLHGSTTGAPKVFISDVVNAFALLHGMASYVNAVLCASSVNASCIFQKKQMMACTKATAAGWEVVVHLFSPGPGSKALAGT